jgi:hypothetical protein
MAGSGLYIAPNEKDPIKQNAAIRQLMEGRSNAVGTFTLTNDGVATTTVVTAPNCGPSSVISLPCPMTAAASTFLRGNSMYIAQANIKAGQFTVTHTATATANLTFMWAAFG